MSGRQRHQHHMLQDACSSLRVEVLLGAGGTLQLMRSSLSLAIVCLSNQQVGCFHKPSIRGSRPALPYSTSICPLWCALRQADACLPCTLMACTNPTATPAGGPSSPTGAGPTLPASAFTPAEMSERPLPSASRRTGTIRPCGVCTATLMSTLWYCRMKSPIQLLFTPGTFLRAYSRAHTRVME